MIRRILSLLRPEPVEVPDLIATRAVRVENRSRASLALALPQGRYPSGPRPRREVTRAVLIAQAHYFTQQAHLAITLAWVAGYTNIVALIACGTVTSHVTGNASNFGRHVVEGSWPAAVFMLFVLASFFAGACISAILTESGWRRGSESIYVLPSMVQAILLAAFAVGLEMRDQGQPPSTLGVWWLTGLASMAMGLQNATITRISSMTLGKLL